MSRNRLCWLVSAHVSQNEPQRFADVVSEDAHGKEQITVYNPECLATEPEEVTDVDGDGVVEIQRCRIGGKSEKTRRPK